MTTDRELALSLLPRIAQPSSLHLSRLDDAEAIVSACRAHFIPEDYCVVPKEPAMTTPTPLALSDAIAAGDGTLHGAIDYWQNKASTLERKTISQAAEIAELRRELVERCGNADVTGAELAERPR